MAVGWWAEVFAWSQTTINKLITNMQGAQSHIGHIATTMKPLQNQSAGWMDPLGTMASSLKKLSTDMEGVQQEDVFSTSATELKKLATQATGGQTHGGVIATVMQKLATALAGTQTHSGSIASTLKKLVTQIIATMTPVPVGFNNIGPGSTNFSTTTTWDHASVGGDDYVIVDVELSQASSCTVTCGGAAMTQLASVNVNGTAYAFRFGLKLNADPGGTKTIVVTPSTNTEITARSAAYNRVVSVATTVIATGTGTAPSQAATCASGERIVQGFFVYNASANGVTLTSPTGGTNRYTLSLARTGIALADASANATFGITINASRPWAGFVTVLKPL